MIRWRALVAIPVLALGVSGCSGSVSDLPLPGGAKLGPHPFTVTAEFGDVLDLVPQSAVKVDDVSVGRVSKITLNGWHAEVTMQINDDVALPDNTIATIRQTSILGEKFVSLEPPATGAVGRLSNGDTIPLSQTGDNPEIEQVLSALSLVLNGGSIAKLAQITTELNHTLNGRETDTRVLLNRLQEIVGTAAASKRDLVRALQQVDRLARQTKAQTTAIDGALDHLPQALKVVNDQRQNLVTMISSLTTLSSTATSVIARSKKATVHDLQRLSPILANLSQSGDDLIDSLRVLPTFPFPDAVVGDTPTKAASTRTGDYLNSVVTFETDFGATFQKMTPAEQSALLAWLESQDGLDQAMVGSAIQ